MEEETRLDCISKLIYLDVAKYYNTLPSCVERNIRTLISAIWEHGNYTCFEKIAGRRLKKKPTNKEFMDMIHHHYKSQIPE